MEPQPATFAPQGTFPMGIRGYQKPEDDGVVFDPWFRQLESLPAKDLYPRIFKRMSKADWQHHIDTVIKPLVARCHPVFACHRDAPFQVFGWACGEHQDDRQVLHMVYVREPWRRKGVATKLLQICFPRFKKDPIYYTHQTRQAQYFTQKWLLKFNPYLVNPVNP